MKINNFLIADKIYINPSTHKLNIEGVFDIIHTKSFPAIHQELFTLTIFEGPNKKYNYHLSLKHNSKIVIESKTTIVKKIGKEHNIITKLNNIPLLETGEHIFEVKLDNQTVKKTIEVKKG